MFFKISFLLVSFQFLLGIDLSYCQGSNTPTPPPMASQNCFQFSTPNEKWFTYQGMTNCYYRSPNSYNSWHQAYDYCRSKGANLASIHSYNMNYYLSHLDTSFYNFYYWIGLNSLTKRAIYTWTDNSAVEFTRFANVTASGDPIPQNPFDQGRCVSFKSMPKNTFYSKVNLGFWFKEDCNSYRSFICEKSTDTSAQTTTAPPPPGNCPQDWFQYANQKCIKYVKEPMTFNDGRDFCMKKNDAELLSIHSEEEQSFITAYTADKPEPYIGFRKLKYYSSWSWDDNKPVDFTNWGYYKNYNYMNDVCTIIITNSSQPGMWTRVNCTAKRPVICEKALDPTIANPGITYITSKCKIPGFDNFIQYRNSCYSVIDSDPNKFPTFSDAENNCKAMNAHLVSIVEPFEEAFLRYFIEQYGKSDNYWIGLQSQLNGVTNVSQAFEWTDDWPVYHTNWDDFEPQFAGLPQEECVSFAKSNGTWRTTMCDTNNAYICKTTTNPLPKLGSKNGGVCPTLSNTTTKSLLWVDIDRRSPYCYWFSVDRKMGYNAGLQSWTDASFSCRRRNGTLVSIHTDHELKLMKKKLSQTGNYYNTWIGLSTDTNGDYIWEDGSALDYTNWDPDENIVTKTDDLSDNSGHQCIEVKGSDEMWKQQPCSGTKRNYFICATKKVDSLNGAQKSGETAGMTGGAKTGIAFGVIGGVVVLLVIGFFALKRYRPNSPVVSSFGNSLYASGRSNGPANS